MSNNVTLALQTCLQLESKSFSWLSIYSYRWMFLNRCSQPGFKLALTEPVCQGWRNAGEGLFTWNPKSTEAEDSREESSWGDRSSLVQLWDLSGKDPRLLLSVLSAWSRGSVVCHLSSAWSKGYHEYKLFCIPSNALSPREIQIPFKTQSGYCCSLQESIICSPTGTRASLSLPFKKLLESSILSMTKICL